MSSDASIQMLFAQLRVEHFLAYLPTKGWQDAAATSGHRVRYELPDESDSPYVIDLPESNHSRQSSKLLQRAIHCLSGVEDRQPREIVYDLLAVAVPAEPEVSVCGNRVRLRVRNLQTTAVALRIASRGAENTLFEGEAMEFLCRVADDGVLEVAVDSNSIEIKDQTASSPRS